MASPGTPGVGRVSDAGESNCDGVAVAPSRAVAGDAAQLVAMDGDELVEPLGRGAGVSGARLGQDDPAPGQGQPDHRDRNQRRAVVVSLLGGIRRKTAPRPKDPIG
jgi:hypothetical protein